jgi:hypothetical protein
MNPRFNARKESAAETAARFARYGCAVVLGTAALTCFIASVLFSL